MQSILGLKLISIEAHGFHIFITAKVNGKLANLLVDTGASQTVFDTNRFQKFDKKQIMEANDHLSTGLGTSNMQSHTIILKKFQLGDLILKKYELFLLDLSHVNGIYKKLKYKPIDGVIGGDILEKYKAIVNYKKAQLILHY